jgi:hypothetical protein
VTSGLAAREQLPPAVRDATAELHALGIPFAFPLSPACAPWSLARRMAAACTTYLAGVDALVSGYARGDPRRLAAALGLPEEMVALWDALPAQDWALVARPDVIVRDGQPLVIEPNATSHAALFALNDALLRAQRAAGPDFPRPDAVPLVTMARYARLLRSRLAAPGGIVALCYFAVEDTDERAWAGWYYRTCVRELSRYGVPARTAHVEALTIDSDGVWLDGERVGLVHRFFEPPVDGHEWELVRRLREAADRGLVYVLTDYRGEVFAAKGCLALLSDERYRDAMPPPLADRLGRALPWTRLLAERATRYGDQRIDLLPWVVRHRSRLVLKGMHGLGGNQVVVGREVSAEAWQRAVDAALAGPVPWLVQELLVPDPEEVVLFRDGERVPLRLPVVYGAFMLERRFVGAVRRYGVGGMGQLNINGHLGAIPTPVYWTGLDPAGVPNDLLAPEPN